MSAFQELFPQDELGLLCKILALEVNEFARGERTLPLEERDEINSIYASLSSHPANSNIARLPDECILAALQAAGAGVHAIGEILEKGVNVPFIPSILARTTAENCSIVRYICTAPDSTKRVARAINAFYKNLCDSGAAQPGHHFYPVYQGIKEVHQRLPQIGISKQDKLPTHYRSLVETYLKDFKGPEVYDELSRSTHYNMVAQVEMIAYADHGTLHNYIAIYDRSLWAACLLIYATESALPFRAVPSQKLIDIVATIRSKAREFDEYCLTQNKE